MSLSSARRPSLRAERGFPDLERTAVEGLGLGVAALPAVEQGQVAQAVADGRMIGAEGLPADLERALVEGLRLAVSTLVAVDAGQSQQLGIKAPADA